MPKIINKVAYLCVYSYLEPWGFGGFVLFCFWMRVLPGTPGWPLPWQSPASAFKLYCTRKQLKVLFYPVAYHLKHWADGLTIKKPETWVEKALSVKPFTIKSCSHQIARLLLYSLCLQGRTKSSERKELGGKFGLKRKDKLSSRQKRLRMEWGCHTTEKCQCSCGIYCATGDKGQKQFFCCKNEVYSSLRCESLTSIPLWGSFTKLTSTCHYHFA